MRFLYPIFIVGSHGVNFHDVFPRVVACIRNFHLDRKLTVLQIAFLDILPIRHAPFKRRIGQTVAERIPDVRRKPILPFLRRTAFDFSRISLGALRITARLPIAVPHVYPLFVIHEIIGVGLACRLHVLIAGNRVFALSFIDVIIPEIDKGRVLREIAGISVGKSARRRHFPRKHAAERHNSAVPRSAYPQRGVDFVVIRIMPRVVQKTELHRGIAVYEHDDMLDIVEFSDSFQQGALVIVELEIMVVGVGAFHRAVAVFIFHRARKVEPLAVDAGEYDERRIYLLVGAAIPNGSAVAFDGRFARGQVYARILYRRIGGTSLARCRRIFVKAFQRGVIPDSDRV